MHFSDTLIDWYLENKRSLPWRETNNPYFIWLSEIILQQTRVVQGMDYYFAFINKYPTIHHLAQAEEEDVMKLWQGLGYYTRARNLHATAQIVCKEYNGDFPQEYEQILMLKGIGRYTAAAIISFAFKKPYPVVDGNVFRFISRLKGIYTPIQSVKAYDEFETILRKLIDLEHPDLFNHALMEHGAMVCKPLNPCCKECVFNKDCFALQNNKIQLLPVKNKPKQAVDRFFYYLVIKVDIPENGSCIILNKRVQKGIWKNLYEFPCIESTLPLDSCNLTNQIRLFLEKSGISDYVIVVVKQEVKHQLTHQTIYATFVEVLTNTKPLLPANSMLIPLSELMNYPVSVLIDRYLKNL